MIAKTLLKSIGAVLAGMLAGAILSVATDAILENTGVFPTFADQQANGSPTWLLLWATFYRTIYTILGGYITARLAPGNGKRLALILGILGVLANAGGGIAMWQLGQHWYPFLLAVLSVPSTLLGWKLYDWQKTRTVHV
ncbi:MAG: hypothetical protein JWM56_314 [Candidatus Peribacteria bacterium]|nr:hypothetical protein [Candidatus Peribacteria bacterium]